MVVRVDESMPAKQQSLDEVKADIVRILKREAAVNASADLASELLAKLQKGDSKMQDLVKEGVEFTPVGWLERENRRVLPQLTQAIFKAPKPSGEAPSYTTYQLPTGDSVVIEVLRVEEGTLPEDEAIKAQLKEALINLSATSEVDARIQTMMDAAKIEKMSNYKTIKPAGL